MCRYLLYKSEQLISFFELGQTSKLLFIQQLTYLSFLQIAKSASQLAAESMSYQRSSMNLFMLRIYVQTKPLLGIDI